MRGSVVNASRDRYRSEFCVFLNTLAFEMKGAEEPIQVPIAALCDALSCSECVPLLPDSNGIH